VQVINKKSGAAVSVEPLQHFYQLFISEMMTEKGGENDVRLLS
jgi:hypothetical protein